MFELISYEKFRNTPGVKFFDITIGQSNARDLVIHDGPAVSPNNTEEGAWQFYLHPHQEDNLLALSGGRTFYLVNFSWEYPFHMVRLDADGDGYISSEEAQAVRERRRGRGFRRGVRQTGPMLEQ